MKQYKVLFIDSTVIRVAAKNKNEAQTKAVRIKQTPVHSVSVVKI